MSFRNSIIISLILALVLLVYVFDALKFVDFLSHNSLTRQNELAQFKQRGVAHGSLELSDESDTISSAEENNGGSGSSVNDLEENNQHQCRRKPDGSSFEYKGLLAERYVLTTDGAHLPSDVRFALESRLDDVFSQYEIWLSLPEKGRLPLVPIELTFLSSDPEDPNNFDRILTTNGLDPQNIQGIYFSSSQRSIVKVNSIEQAIDTAVHEAVHAINDIYFDRLPRFINEGIAEFFESNLLLDDAIVYDGEITEYALPKWLDLSSPYDDLLDFYTLLYSETDWHTSNNRSLYFSGNVWFRFLLESEQSNRVLTQLLQQKFNAPCESLTPEDISDTLTELYPLFEQDFSYWFEQKVEQSRAQKSAQ